MAPKDDGFVFLPPEAGYLWNVWEECHLARSSGMATNPISWSDLEAYVRLSGEALEPWEARAVRAIDDAYLAAIASDETTEGAA